jgi:hypothetical protein
VGEGQGIHPTRTKFATTNRAIECGQPRGPSDERRKEERRPRRNAKPATKKGWIPTPIEPTNGEKEKVWRVETIDQTKRKSEGKAKIYPKTKPLPTKRTKGKMEKVEGERGKKNLKKTEPRNPSRQKKMARSQGPNASDGPRQD